MLRAAVCGGAIGVVSPFETLATVFQGYDLHCLYELALGVRNLQYIEGIILSKVGNPCHVGFQMHAHCSHNRGDIARVRHVTCVQDPTLCPPSIGGPIANFC